MLKVLAREHLQRLLTSKRKLNRTGTSTVLIVLKAFASKVIFSRKFLSSLFAKSDRVVRSPVPVLKRK